MFSEFCSIRLDTRLFHNVNDLLGSAGLLLAGSYGRCIQLREPIAHVDGDSHNSVKYSCYEKKIIKHKLTNGSNVVTL